MKTLEFFLNQIVYVEDIHARIARRDVLDTVLKEAIKAINHAKSDNKISKKLSNNSINYYTKIKYYNCIDETGKENKLNNLWIVISDILKCKFNIEMTSSECRNCFGHTGCLNDVVKVLEEQFDMKIYLVRIVHRSFIYYRDENKLHTHYKNKNAVFIGIDSRSNSKCNEYFKIEIKEN